MLILLSYNFAVHNSFIVSNQKVKTIQVSINRRTDKHTIEYYLSIKNDILTYGQTLKICQVKQASYKRTNILLFHLHGMSRIGKFMEKERRIEVTRGCGEGNMGSYCFMITEFLFGAIKTLGNR